MRWLIWFIPVALFVWVAASALDLDGRTRVVWVPGGSSPFVRGLRPTGRVELHDDVATLTGDPVYLSVMPPGNYERATITTTFAAPEQPVVELGATVNAQAGHVQFVPLLNTTLDRLSWQKTIGEHLTLWQRTPRYDSVEDFFEDMPPYNEIATYHTSLSPHPDGSSYATGSESVRTLGSLRGTHTFISVTDGRDIALDIEYQDMNRNPGADPVTVRIVQDGQLLAEARRDDDGVEGDAQAALGRQTLRVAARDVEAGLVTVELNASSDVYWRDVRLSLPKMAFVRNVTVGDEVGYLPQPRAVSLYTNAQYVTLYTRHAEGVQTVRVGSRAVNVAVPHERYDVENTDGGVVRVEIPRGDLVVETDGMVAFSREAFFDPFPLRVDDRTEVERRDIQYVLAQYTPPEIVAQTDWLKGSATFLLGGLEREEGTGAWRFVYSLPRVHDRGAHVDIARIEIDFERPPRTPADVWRILFRRVAAIL